MTSKRHAVWKTEGRPLLLGHGSELQIYLGAGSQQTRILEHDLYRLARLDS